MSWEAKGQTLTENRPAVGCVWAILQSKMNSNKEKEENEEFIFDTDRHSIPSRADNKLSLGRIHPTSTTNLIFSYLRRFVMWDRWVRGLGQFMATAALEGRPPWLRRASPLGCRVAITFLIPNLRPPSAAQRASLDDRKESEER